VDGAVMLTLTTAQVASWVGSLLWPFLRIGAMFAAAPIFSARMVPVRVRVLLALLMAWILLPVLPRAPAVDPISAQGLLIGLHQVLIGLSMGFALQLVFAALAVAGESVALSMGLGFASMVDPENGVQVPVVGSYYVLLATLLFIAFNGHLVLIGVLADSFQTLPIGGGGPQREGLWQLVHWAASMFAGGLMIALPALSAMLLVNLAFGVITRAAPQLNVFAVGFPITLLLGFVLLLLTVPSLAPNFEALLAAGFELMGGIIEG
jgi:flagellar biosynthetic protein FliR